MKDHGVKGTSLYFSKFKGGYNYGYAELYGSIIPKSEFLENPGISLVYF